MCMMAALLMHTDADMHLQGDTIVVAVKALATHAALYLGWRQPLALGLH